MEIRFLNYGAVGEVTLMFTITFRVTKKQLAAAAAALVLAFAGGLWAKSELAGDVAQAPAEVKIEKTAAKTNEQRVSFLESFGWEVEPEAEEILDVLIPKEMDDVFSNYNEIQKAQGCDLTKYAGKRCKRYTYIVNNYPDQPENIRANIVTYKNKIIGGDVELNGFMQGFAAETDGTRMQDVIQYPQVQNRVCCFAPAGVMRQISGKLQYTGKTA